jgi:hypothetical protein
LTYSRYVLQLTHNGYKKYRLFVYVCDFIVVNFLILRFYCGGLRFYCGQFLVSTIDAKLKNILKRL